MHRLASKIAALIVFLTASVASLMFPAHQLPHSIIISVSPALYDSRFEVFYDLGKGLFDKPSIVQFGGASATHLEFDFTQDSLRGLRVDPGSTRGIILIESIHYGSYTWRADDLAKDFAPEFDISEFASDGKILSITSTGEDPRFVFKGDFRRIYGLIDSENARSSIWIHLLWILVIAAGSFILMYMLGHTRFESMTKRIRSKSASSDLVLTALFVVMLCLPVLGSKLGLSPDIRLMGVRDQTPPEVGVTSWTKFPAMFESYFNATFGFRGLLIRYYNSAKVFWLHTSPMPKIILGKASWLYYDSDEFLGDGVTIKDYRGLAPFTGAQLLSIKNTLERNRDSLSRLGCLYVVAVAPNKNTIYDEYLPEYLNRVHPVTRLDQVLTYLGDSVVQIVDLREVLRKGKTTYPTYYQANTHWNSYGAFLADQEIIRSLQHVVPGLSPMPISDFAIEIRNRSTSDIAEMMALGGIIGDQDVNLRERTPREQKERVSLYFIHDSFGTPVKWFLERQFNPVYYGKEKNVYNFREIGQFRPRIVLHLIAERYLDKFLQ